MNSNLLVATSSKQISNGSQSTKLSLRAVTLSSVWDSISVCKKSWIIWGPPTAIPLLLISSKVCNWKSKKKIGDTHFITSEYSCTMSQKRSINFVRSNLSFSVTVILLNAATSLVMSSISSMKSQVDPKIILKNNMPFITVAPDPADSAIHATKYPLGVFQSKGHLFLQRHTQTHKNECFA